MKSCQLAKLKEMYKFISKYLLKETIDVEQNVKSIIQNKLSQRETSKSMMKLPSLNMTMESQYQYKNMNSIIADGHILTK